MNIVDTAPPAGRQQTPESSQMEWRPGEFTLADAWFPVAHTPDARRGPILRLVHSTPYYIWSAEGAWRAESRHPLNRDPKQDVRSYPVEERYGHVWVWYGDPANADPTLIPDIPFLRRNRSQAAHARGVNFFHCTYELVLENILDLTHIDFVHGSMTGAAEHAEEDNVTFESTSETVTMIRKVKGRLTSRFQREKLGVTETHQDQTVFTHIFIRSGVCFLHSHYSTAPSIPLMQSNTPESRTLTRANFAFGIEQTDNLLFRRAWPATASIIAGQDESVLNPQNQRYYGQPPRRDCSTRFDAAGLRYRKLHGDLVARQKAGDCSYQRDYRDGTDVASILKIRRMD